MSDEKIVILGGGITGLTAAERLSRIFGDKVILIEKEEKAGGLAATLSRNGVAFDLGSHRLHIETSPEVIHYLKDQIGVSLMRRRRRGKLYFRGRFISYPPNIFNLLRVFSTHDIFKSIASYMANYIFPSKIGRISFESVMIRIVGCDIYMKVYRDYAKKLWGVNPAQISIDAVHRRKSVLDVKSLSKAFQDKHYFLYPKFGIGEIVEKMEQRIMFHGAKVIKNTQIEKAVVNREGIILFPVSTEAKPEKIMASKVVSTMPIDELYSIFFNDSDMPKLNWRGIRLLYIILDQRLQDSAETFYFPSLDIVLGRVSEVGKYSPYLNSGLQGSLLTVEIPVSKGDAIWEMEENKLLELCLNDLHKTSIIDKNHRVVEHFSFCLDKVYPLYEIGWKEKFFAMYDRLKRIDNLFTVGRGGLFSHCNMDHCITEGLEIANFILKRNSKDKKLWQKYTDKFLKFSARD